MREKLEEGLEDDEMCLVVKKKYWDFWKCQFRNNIEPMKIVQNEENGIRPLRKGSEELKISGNDPK